MDLEICDDVEAMHYLHDFLQFGAPDSDQCGQSLGSDSLPGLGCTDSYQED